MGEQSADGTEQVPPLNLTSDEFDLLHIVVTTYNDAGAFDEETDDFEDWESLKGKVERIHQQRQLQSDSDRSRGESA
ncbi:hypothetical protein C446_13564 [Halobiforma nitratireducens JCM 10879]|uniref:Uncharacterized protein n=1 Tax=Halobiforma nitratireducens JCM 10879 TaxID=1227454 RepID=M0LPZ9_9EURY|nr:hypothetical protein C446_13564 [Halobiforma nitratireducens JCM 10879]